MTSQIGVRGVSYWAILFILFRPWITPVFMAVPVSKSYIDTVVNICNTVTSCVMPGPMYRVHTVHLLL